MTQRLRIGSMAACAAATLCAHGAHAFTLERVETRYAEKQYRCELTVTLAAPRERVAQVLRDYERYPTLDSRILDASVLERPSPDVVLLSTTLRACFGWFCRNVRRIERVEESPEGLAAITDPARSDVRFGETYTTVSDVDGGTRVVYRTAITPGFWVPSLVGRRWMLNTLEEATTELFRNVERQAQEAASP